MFSVAALIVLGLAAIPAPTLVEASLPMGSGRTFMPYGQRWLGSDASYSIGIGNRTWLWMFDDTITGIDDDSTRQQSLWVHNTVGRMQCTGGTDERPEHCSIDYYWGNANKTSGVFLTGLEQGTTDDEFYWQNDLLIYNDTLYVFLQRTRAVTTGLGFTAVGTALVTVENYRDSPLEWRISYQNVTVGGTFTLAQALSYQAGVGGNPYPPDANGADYLYSFSNVDPVKGPDFTSLMRFPLAQLQNASQLSGLWQYWSSNQTWLQWRPDPSFSIIPADMQQLWATQPGTVKFHAATQQWVNVAPSPQAFFGGGVTVSIALTPSITGPWPPLQPLYQTPETNTSSPLYIKDSWCYASFEHPEYENPDGSDIVFTYVCNSYTVNQLLADDRLYRAEMVRLPWPSNSPAPTSKGAHGSQWQRRRHQMRGSQAGGEQW